MTVNALRLFCFALVLQNFHFNAAVAETDESDRALLLKLAANYDRIPARFSVSYTYSAIACRDYSLFHHNVAVLEREQRSPKHPDPLGLPLVAKGASLSMIDCLIEGAPDSFVFHFESQNSNNPALNGLHAIEGLVQGGCSLIRCSPGSYVNLSSDHQELPVTSSARVLTTLPIYIPYKPGALPSERFIGYGDLLRTLASDPSILFQHKGDVLIVRAIIDRHPNDAPGSELSRELTLTIDPSSPSLKEIRFHMDDREPDHGIVRFPNNIITFSNYGSVGMALIPKTIQFTSVASLYDFGGADPIDNATILGEDLTQLRTKAYEIITHRYDILNIQPLDSYAPRFRLNRGETVVNRISNTYIHLPKAISVADIPAFISQSVGYTNHSFASSAADH